MGSLIRNDNTLPVVSFDAEGSRIRLGFVGDMILGLGGSAAVIFLFGSTLKFDPADPNTYPLLISVCFLAGVFGRLVVEMAGRRMIQEALNRATDAERGVEKLRQPSAAMYILESREQFKAGEYEKALDSAEKALQLDRANIKAMNAKARALKKLNRLTEAFDVIEKALRLPKGSDPIGVENNSVLAYNRVCYGILLQKVTPQDAIASLRSVFGAFPRLREVAKTDHDLDVIRQTAEFKELIGE